MIWNTDRMDYYAADCFKGMAKALPGRWQCLSIGKNIGVLIKAKPTLDRFAIIISGGSGNGPLFSGYVGEGLADAAVVGAPYAAPNAYAIYETGKFLGSRNGVLLLFNNFAGDYLNNDMAQELLTMDGIQVEMVISNDDIATALGEPQCNRSGRSGIALLIKMAGACAKSRMPLEKAAALLRQANKRLGTISMHVNFDKGEIEYGAGFSGEPGILTVKHMNMRLGAREAMDMLTSSLKPTNDEKLFLQVNRLRLTSYPDSYIMANATYEVLSERYTVAQMRVAAFSNIVDTYGFDFSILCMDDEMAELMDDYLATDSFMI
jgi:dihydroxyacetone kinase-like protein